MRYFLLTLALASLAFGQDASRQYSTFTYDINGRAVNGMRSATTTPSGGSFQTETTQSINGRTVPLEQVEENVISEGPGGRVVERVVRRFDQGGRRASLEKVRIEERPNASGGSTVVTTVFDSDVNGRFAVRERAIQDTSRSGDIVRAETIVERPTVNGSMDAIEKRQSVQTGTDANRLTDVTVQRPTGNGGFAQSERQTIQTVVVNNETTETTAVYNTTSTGQMALAGQRVSRTQRNADGSEMQVVDIYGGNSAGRATSGYNSELKLREQQLIERKPGPGQSLVETFSVRRSSLESGALGPVRKISETVCSGKCVPEPPKAAEPPKQPGAPRP